MSSLNANGVEYDLVIGGELSSHLMKNVRRLRMR